MAAVPFSQLKDYKYYIVPTPSDEARFLTGTMARNADEYMKQQRRLLLNYVGRRMHLLGNRDGTWNAQLHRDDNGKIESTYFDESSFPPGQLFQEVGWDWKPGVAMAPAAQPAGHPWDEFASTNDYDYDDDAEVKGVEITDVLSKDDVLEQDKFGRSLTGDEKGTLAEYKQHAHRFVTPLMLGHKDAQAAAEAYAKDAKKGPGFIEEFMSTFKSTLSKAPKLTKEINVFRGVVGKEGLNMPGKQALSTSYDKYVATRFAEERGCCIFKIIVKPGVGVIALDMILGESEEDGEKEILICPPYTAKIEDVGDPESGVKKVTITPATPGGGRRSKVTSKKAAKKTCAPGYAVYNYRKTRKGVFYDCAPRRKTRRSRK